MQLSNKILIGFFGFILLYILAGFADVRLNGTDRRGLSGPDAKVESAPIGVVKYLILPDINQHIVVNTSDDPRIEFRSSSGAVLSKLKYEIIGDTLKLERFDSDKKEPVNFLIYVRKNDLAGIEVNKSRVTIKNLNQSTLSITQSGGRVFMEKNNNLGNLNLSASEKADFQAQAFGLDSLSIQSNNSNMTFRSSVKHLEGKIVNHSYLQVKGPDEIVFKKDETCRINLTKN